MSLECGCGLHSVVRCAHHTTVWVVLKPTKWSFEYSGKFGYSVSAFQNVLHWFSWAGFLPMLLGEKGRVLFNPGWVIRYENCLNVKKTAQKHALVCKIKFWWRKVSSVFWFGHYLRHSLGYFGFSRAELHFQKLSRKKVRKTGGVFGH